MPERHSSAWRVLDIVLAAAVIFTGAVPNAFAKDLLQMVKGQQRILQAAGVTRIAVADPSVIDVKVIGPGEVLVTANGDGQTELTVWRGAQITAYDVVVSTVDPKQLAKDVEKTLGEREGITVKVIRDLVYIEGQALTLQDLEAAEEIARGNPQIRNTVRLDPTAHSHIADAINKQLARVGLSSARATVVGRTIFLEGVVDSPGDLKKAEIITQGMGENIQSVLTVGVARMVELDVEFVEVSSSSLDRIGITWPTDINGSVAAEYARTDVIRGTAPNSEAFTGSASATASFGLALRFNDGITRILARPRLIAGSNQEATFLAGGEIPIPLITQNNVYVEYKEYGVRLKITPAADANGTITAKILTEVSQIDDAVTVMGFPGFLSRRVDTQVTVKDGETIVLSGLLQASDGKDVSKVPILGHIPIIGELFKSRRFIERRTELVVFVTPRIVDPVSKHLRQLVRDMQQRYDEAESQTGWELFD